jgi:MFS family permease
VQVWHIVVLAFLLGLTNALDMPARYTFLVEIVGPEDLRSGIAVNAILNSGSRVLGPALAGLALVQFGAAWCFLINGLSFVAVIFFLVIMKVPYPMASVAHNDPVRQLKEGLNFARSHERILPLLLLASIGGFFIIPVIQVLPSFADVVLHSPTAGYAAVTAAEGIGSIISGISVGWLAHRFGYGRIASVSALAAGITTFLVSQQTSVPVASAVVAFSGLFTTLLVIGSNTLIQIAVPDNFRGRVLALFTLCFPGLSPFGALVLGLISNEIGVSTGIALWGILGTILGGAILMRWPHVRHARE